VIVVNWNRREDTLRCLASLASVPRPPIDVFVVDNGSSDGSVAAIREAYPATRLLVSERNLGFAEGNNLAIQAALDAGYDFLLLLNNDTIVARDAVEQLLQPMSADPSLGVVSGAVCYLARPDVVWSAGGQINWRDGSVTSDHYGAPLGRLPTAPWQVEHVTGCCMLVRAQAVRDAGLLDPRFFMYYEETEWCVRIARAGYRIVVNPQALIWHAIDPVAQEGSARIAYYMTRNHLLFLRATHAPARAWAITIGRQLRTVASLAVRSHSPGRRQGRVPMLRALRDFALGRFGPLPEA
jgi:hypothetical protein